MYSVASVQRTAQQRELYLQTESVCYSLLSDLLAQHVQTLLPAFLLGNITCKLSEQMYPMAYQTSPPISTEGASFRAGRRGPSQQHHGKAIQCTAVDRLWSHDASFSDASVPWPNPAKPISPSAARRCASSAHMAYMEAARPASSNPMRSFADKSSAWLTLRCAEQLNQPSSPTLNQRRTQRRETSLFWQRSNHSTPSDKLAFHFD